MDHCGNVKSGVMGSGYRVCNAAVYGLVFGADGCGFKAVQDVVSKHLESRSYAHLGLKRQD